MTMTIMEWNAKLDIGVEDMNDQHKVLLDIMNKLHDAHLKNEPFSIQHGLMKDLATATIDHFQKEEKLMESIHFEKLSVHKVIHKDLLTKYSIHMDESEKTQNIDEEFFKFLKFWLSAHIMSIDTQYAKLCT